MEDGESINLLEMPEEASGACVFVDNGNGRMAWLKVVEHTLMCGRQLTRYVVGMVVDGAPPQYAVMCDRGRALGIVAQFVGMR